MFDKKEIEAYRSISAPDTLRDRILNEYESETKSPKYTFAGVAKMLGSLAACFVLAVVFSVLAVGNFGSASVSYNGEALSENEIVLADENAGISPLFARMISQTEVPLLFTLNDKTEFSVSDGVMQMMDPDTEELLDFGYKLTAEKAEKNVLIRWSVCAEPDLAPEKAIAFEMAVRSGKKSYVIVLSFDADARVWTIAKKPNA